MWFKKKKKEAPKLPPLPELPPMHKSDSPIHELPDPPPLNQLPKEPMDTKPTNTEPPTEQTIPLEPIPQTTRPQPPKIPQIIPKTPQTLPHTIAHHSPKEKPVYIKINRYENALENFENIKDHIREASETIAKIKDIRRKEDADLAAWETELGEIKRKLAIIDKKLFSETE